MKSVNSQVLTDSSITRAELTAVREMGQKMQRPQEAARTALWGGLLCFNIAALLYLLVKIPEGDDNTLTRGFTIVSICVGMVAFLAAVVLANVSFRKAQARIQQCSGDGKVSAEDSKQQCKLRMELEAVDKRGEEATATLMMACFILSYNICKRLMSDMSAD
eukprot:gene10349-8700_t